MDREEMKDKTRDSSTMQVEELAAGFIELRMVEKVKKSSKKSRLPNSRKAISPIDAMYQL